MRNIYSLKEFKEKSVTESRVYKTNEASSANYGGFDMGNRIGWSNSLVGRMFNKIFSFANKKAQTIVLGRYMKQIQNEYLKGVLIALYKMNYKKEDVKDDTSLSVNVYVVDKTNDKKKTEIFMPVSKTTGDSGTTTSTDSGLTYVYAHDNKKDIKNYKIVIEKTDSKQEITPEVFDDITMGTPMEFTVTSNGTDIKYNINVKEKTTRLSKTSADLNSPATKEDVKGIYKKIKQYYIDEYVNNTKVAKVDAIKNDLENNLKLTNELLDSKVVVTSGSTITKQEAKEYGLLMKQLTDACVAIFVEDGTSILEKLNKFHDIFVSIKPVKDSETMKRSNTFMLMCLEDFFNLKKDKMDEETKNKFSDFINKMKNGDYSGIKKEKAVSGGGDEQNTGGTKLLDQTNISDKTDENFFDDDSSYTMINEEYDYEPDMYELNEDVNGTFKTNEKIDIKTLLKDGSRVTPDLRKALKEFGEIHFDNFDIDEIIDMFAKDNSLKQLAIKTVNKEALKEIAIKAHWMFNEDKYKDTRNDVYSRMNWTSSGPDMKKLEHTWKKNVASAKKMFWPLFADDNGNFPNKLLDPDELLKADPEFSTTPSFNNTPNPNAVLGISREEINYLEYNDNKGVETIDGKRYIFVCEKNKIPFALLLLKIEYQKMHIFKFLGMLDYNKMVTDFNKLPKEKKDDKAKSSISAIIKDNTYMNNMKSVSGNHTIPDNLKKMFDIFRRYPQGYTDSKGLITAFVQDQDILSSTSTVNVLQATFYENAPGDYKRLITKFDADDMPTDFIEYQNVEYTNANKDKIKDDYWMKIKLTNKMEIENHAPSWAFLNSKNEGEQISIIKGLDKKKDPNFAAMLYKFVH